MKTEVPWYIGGIESLINDMYIEIPQEDRDRLALGAQRLKEGKAALVPFNHIALPDPPFIAALLMRHWRGLIQNMQIPASQKFYDGRMGKPGRIALNLATEVGVGMPPIIQAGDKMYSEAEQKAMNDNTMLILLQTLQIDGGVVPYAPEGTRSRTGALIPSRAFADMLSHDLDFSYTQKVFVQPIAMWGTEQLWSIESNYPRPFTRVHIRVAEPVSLTQLREEAAAYDFSALNKMKVTNTKSRGKKPIGDMIMTRIAAMLPEQYRGVYAPYLKTGA